MTENHIEYNASFNNFRLFEINSFFLNGYSPFLSFNRKLQAIKNMSRVSLFFLFLTNFLYRCYDFATITPFLVLYVLGTFARATIYNIIFLLGGFLSQRIFYNAGKYNQLAIKSFFFVLFNTSAFLIEQIKLLVGLFFPHYILQTLKDINNDNGNTSKDLYESQYLFYVYKIGSFLQKFKLFKLSMIITSLLSEPVDSIIHGIRMIKGKNKDFYIHGANPQQLSEEQKQYLPILCLHGYAHNQSAFEQILLSFKNTNPNQPVFTLNLLDIEINDAKIAEKEIQRQSSIDEKVSEIRKLYGKPDIEPIIIGHSSGADAAAIRKNWLLSGNKDLPSFINTMLNQEESASSINQAHSTTKMYILMGANIHSNDTQDVYIKAQYDEILSLPSEQQQIRGKPRNLSNVKEYPTGHLGMLTDPKIIRFCIDEVNSKQALLSL